MSDIRARILAGKNVPVPPLAEEVGISRNGLYQAIKRGEVESVKIGRAIFVPAHEGRRLLGIDDARAA